LLPNPPANAPACRRSCFCPFARLETIYVVLFGKSLMRLTTMCLQCSTSFGSESLSFASRLVFLPRYRFRGWTRRISQVRSVPQRVDHGRKPLRVRAAFRLIAIHTGSLARRNHDSHDRRWCSYNGECPLEDPNGEWWYAEATRSLVGFRLRLGQTGGVTPCAHPPAGRWAHLRTTSPSKRV
jgi:hypothetical protein